MDLGVRFGQLAQEFTERMYLMCLLVLTEHHATGPSFCGSGLGRGSVWGIRSYSREIMGEY